MPVAARPPFFELTFRECLPPVADLGEYGRWGKRYFTSAVSPAP
jgi:hypothetical protein